MPQLWIDRQLQLAAAASAKAQAELHLHVRKAWGMDGSQVSWGRGAAGVGRWVRKQTGEVGRYSRRSRPCHTRTSRGCWGLRAGLDVKVGAQPCRWSPLRVSVQ